MSVRSFRRSTAIPLKERVRLTASCSWNFTFCLQLLNVLACMSQPLLFASPTLHGSSNCSGLKSSIGSSRTPLFVGRFYRVQRVTCPCVPAWPLPPPMCYFQERKRQSWRSVDDHNIIISCHIVSGIYSAQHTQEYAHHNDKLPKI